MSRNILGHVVGEFDSMDPPLSRDILVSATSVDDTHTCMDRLV